MERAIVVRCAILFILLFLEQTSSKSYNNEIETNYLKDDVKKLWFGPRLDRKKRDLSYKKLNLDEEQVLKLLTLFHSPWELISNTGKTRAVNFTPRLGRDSKDSDKWLQDPETSDFMTQRSPPFAPRLGRQLYSQFDTDNDKN